MYFQFIMVILYTLFQTNQVGTPPILITSVIYPAIVKGLKSHHENVRKEFLLLMANLVRTFQYVYKGPGIYISRACLYLHFYDFQNILC